VAGLIVLFAAAAICGAAELAVGPGKEYSRIEDALAKAQAGDVILVHPRPGNQPYEKTAVFVATPRITVRSAGPQRIKLSGQGFDYSGRGRIPRAIFQFNPGADGCVLEGFELYGAHNDSHNGAGVRINQANDVTVRNCHIHGNDMGVMSNGNGTPTAGVNQLFESCLICSNGDPREPGYNHNLYLGGTSATLLGCEVHSSLTGHNVKSRAHLTRVIACYIHDSSNREFDLVDAKGDTTAPLSDAVLAGNIIVKARNCRGNRAVIHFGQDGGNEHDGTIHLVHNTIVTPYISPVVHLSAGRARASLTNNIVWDGGQRQNAQKLIETAKGRPANQAAGGSNNYLSPGFGGGDLSFLGRTILAPPGHAPPFADPAKGDFHLKRPDPKITGAGIPLSEEIRKVWGEKVLGYVSPLKTRERKAVPRPALGAFEPTE